MIIQLFYLLLHDFQLKYYEMLSFCSYHNMNKVQFHKKKKRIYLKQVIKKLFARKMKSMMHRIVFVEFFELLISSVRIIPRYLHWDTLLIISSYNLTKYFKASYCEFAQYTPGKYITNTCMIALSSTMYILQSKLYNTSTLARLYT